MNTKTNLATVADSSAAPANSQPQLAVLSPPAAARSPLALNRRQTEQILLAEVIAQVAQAPEYASRLSNFGIPAAFVTALLTDAAAARARSTEAVQGTGKRLAATSGEAVKEAILVRSLRQIQAAAKALHQHSDPQRLHEYLVGEPIQQSRALLEQASQTILAKADAERPPGIDTALIERVRTERAQYVDSRTPQQISQAQAKAARAQRNTLVQSINERRRKIQLAANAAWPPHVPANVEVRTRFRLPAHSAVGR